MPGTWGNSHAAARFPLTLAGGLVMIEVTYRAALRGTLDVVEPVDERRRGALGLRCRASIFPKLPARVDAVTVLTRLRDALVETERDASLAVMRRLVLHGVAPSAEVRSELRAFDGMRNFVVRARAGIGGTSPAGRMLALPVNDIMALCVASATRQREAIVYLHAIDEIVGNRNLLGLVR
jgi:hypothetical protein